jgi:hypothetical protein
MEIRVRISEPLANSSRMAVEEAIEEWIGGDGEIVGGGAAVDGSWAHIDLNVSDQVVSEQGLPKLIDQLRDVLQAAGVPASTKMIVFESDDTTYESTVG